jgi:uncharacterized membrane protein YdbT with pleckstrin-like domain
MDNNTPANNSAPNTLREYNQLGSKTFWLLILKRSLAFFFILLLSAVLLIAYPYIPAEYQVIAGLALISLVVLLAIAILWALLLGWLEYIHYKIALSADNIKISRGLIAEEEIGIPFRRIKEVNFVRSLTDQMLGVSNVVLIVLGEDDGGPLSQESKIILPSLDVRIAKQIQDIILNKAEVEEVDMNAAAAAVK